MLQLKYELEPGFEKTAYEFSIDEFKLITSGLRMYAHPGKLAIIKSNDTRFNLRPKASLVRGSLEKLTDVIDEHQMQFSAPEPTELDLLRADRLEIRQAIINRNSGLQIRSGHVYLGLYTTAQALDPIRAPYALLSKPTEQQTVVLGMMNQFYSDGVSRIAETV